jgi:hypothetical protein
MKHIIKSKITAPNYKIEPAIDSELNPIPGMQQYRPSLITNNACVQNSPKDKIITDMELTNLGEDELNNDQ